MAELTDKEQQRLYEELDFACFDCDLTEVKKVVAKGADINFVGTDGLSVVDNVLNRSISTNIPERMELIKYLVENGADLTSIKRRVYAKIFPLDFIKYLIENGIKINDSDKIDLILKACVENNVALLEYFVKNGFEVNNPEYVWKLIGKAVNGHSIEVIKYLIDKGLPVDAEKGLALRFAVDADYYDLIEYLMSKGADVDIAIKEANVYTTSEQKDKLLSIKEKYLISNDLKDVSIVKKLTH